jgi:hypothetical protein
VIGQDILAAVERIGPGDIQALDAQIAVLAAVRDLAARRLHLPAALAGGAADGCNHAAALTATTAPLAPQPATPVPAGLKELPPAREPDPKPEESDEPEEPERDPAPEAKKPGPRKPGPAEGRPGNRPGAAAPDPGAFDRERRQVARFVRDNGPTQACDIIRQTGMDGWRVRRALASGWFEKLTATELRSPYRLSHGGMLALSKFDEATAASSTGSRR